LAAAGCRLTRNVTLLLPMLGACVMAMLVPTPLRDAPFYDSLREALPRRVRGARLAKPAINAGADDESWASSAARESRSRPHCRDGDPLLARPRPVCARSAGGSPRRLERTRKK